jgi:hypothetical protein
MKGFTNWVAYDHPCRHLLAAANLPGARPPVHHWWLILQASRQPEEPQIRLSGSQEEPVYHREAIKSA